MLRSALLLVLLWCGAAGAQSGYFNLDAGRPTRVEDAIPGARYELDLQLVPVRYELLANGARRWRVDPKLSYGIAPFTEVEIRVPVLVVDPRTGGSPVTTGLGGLALGALHAFGLETGPLPALALSGEYLIPAGSLAARTGSFAVKGIATKTFPFGRLHANAGVGTWSIRAPSPPTPECPTPSLGAPPAPGCNNSQPVVPDTPCDRLPSPSVAATESARRAGGTVSSTTDVPLSVGKRWTIGLGIDHAFALTSTLLTADVVAERLIDLYALTDWSAEVGVRHQWSPQIVVDLGLTRHLVGLPRSNAISFGLAYDVPLQSWTTLVPHE